MKLFSLDERLFNCASLVRNGARLVDVGSDHALLPVWLLKSGKISFAIASDIGEKPLLSGRENANKYDVKNIEFRLGDGLSVIKPEDRITDIVIAGMGGEVIAKILGESELVKDKKLNLILQPMSRSEDLIGFLYENGFEITEQKALTSKGKSYTVIAAAYSERRLAVSSVFKLTGKLDLTDSESVKFIEKEIRNLENKSRGDRSAEALLDELRLMINEKN